MPGPRSRLVTHVLARSVHLRLVVILAWLVVAAGPPVFAQATATFNGLITDAVGGVLPGVTVTATHLSTARVRTTVTNEEGLYTFPGLESGTYELKAELAGFGTVLTKDVTLTVGATLTLNFTLQPAGVEESITVTGASPLVELTQSEVKSELGAQELQALPMVNRNFQGLVALMPSVRVGIPHDTTKQTGGGVSFSGSNGENVNPTVDGGDNRDDYNGGLLMSYTLEGIQEFRIATHRFSASEGRTSGVSLSIITKSGSNTRAGTAFVFARDSAFSAKDYFTKTNNLSKAPLSRQQFGGSLGGPLVRNRVFYFGALERIRAEAPVTLSDKVFNELKLLEPFGAEPTQRKERPFRDLQYHAKVNVNLSTKHSAFVRWGQQRNWDLNYASYVDTRDEGFQPYTPNKFISLLGSLTSVISTRLVNQVTVQYSDWRIDIITAARGTRTQTFARPEQNLTFPSVSVGRSAGEYDQQRTVQIRDDFTAQMGTHELKFGGDVITYPILFAGTLGNPEGSFSFFDDPSVILTDRARYPQGFQTPGIVRQFSISTPGYGDGGVLGAKQFAAYVQDDWHATRRLTLNLGIRYDVAPNFLNPREFDRNRTYVALNAIGSPYGRKPPNNDVNNVAPRVGFAYQLGGSDRTVLRGGYGQYFDKATSVTVLSQIYQMKPTIKLTLPLINTAPGRGELATYRFGIDPPPPSPGLVTEFPRGKLTTGAWIDPDYEDPSMHQVHVGFSHQWRSDLVLGIDAVHSRGQNEFRSRDINPIEPNGVRRLAPTFGAVLGDPNLLGQISIRNSGGRSRFSSLVFRLEGRTPRVTYRATYELSKAEGWGGNIESRTGSTPQNQDDFDTPGEFGPTRNDERHRVVLFGSFQLPYAVELSPIFQASSARPYTLTSGRDDNADGTNNDRYIDPVTGQKVGVNSERGDPFVVMDMRATRFFNLGSGSKRLAVFVEGFNLFNTVNFGSNYVGNGRSPLFKQPAGLAPQGIGDPLKVQFGARFLF